MSVKLRDLSYIYKKNTVMEVDAVRGVSLEIKNGEFVAVMGKTGCGKSTLLSLIAGVFKPAFGDVETDSGIAMMFQNPENQIFAQTVLEDVMYGPLNIGMKPQDARDVAILSLKSAGLEEDMFDLDPAKLSGGQKRKVALAGILAMNKPMLLLDEPTSNLDSRSAEEIMQVIGNLNKKGITVIVATHDCKNAVKFAKRAVVMDEGKVVEDCSMEKFLEKGDSVMQYGIDIPLIYRVNSLLKKKGLVSEKTPNDAESIISALSFNTGNQGV